jgi:hypothetical protein
MVPFSTKRDATGLAVCARGRKGGALPSHHPLRDSRQEGFRLCQAQPNRLNPLAVLLPDAISCLVSASPSSGHTMSGTLNVKVTFLQPE